MARQDPAITSFNAGELSPLMLGQTEQRRYRNGCEHLLNYIPTVMGPVRRRPGTLAIDTADMNVHGMLVPFVANSDSHAEFVLNVTTLGTYVFNGPTRSKVTIDGSGNWSPFGAGSPAALNTPWSLIVNSLTSECYLQWAQSNDVMWVTHPLHMPVKIKRVGNYKFEWSYMGDGLNPPMPFNDVDPLNTITMQASATTGLGITLTAGSAVFTSDWIDTYFYIEQPAVDIVKQWEPAKAIGAGERRRSNGRNYVALNSATTGTIRPTHSIGAKYDGDTGVQWDFADEGYGVVQITGVTDPTHAIGNVVRVLPASVVSGTTTRWARGAWSAEQGFPTSVSFFRERLVFARDQTIWASVAGDYENFTATEGGLVTDDLAITATIAANSNDRIQWLHPMTKLIAGTKSGLHAIGELAPQDPFGPGNVQSVPFGDCGAAKIPPLRAGNRSIFIQRGNARAHEIRYDFETDGYITRDLMADADHIVGTGMKITGMCYAKSPDNVVWFSAAGATFLGLTINDAQEVLAWHPHRLGGTTVDGVTGAAPGAFAAIMGPDGKNQDVWILSNRFSATSIVGSVEVLGANEDLQFTGTYYYHEWPQTQDACYLDYHRKVEVLAGVTAIPVPWVANGETVRGLIAGCVQPAGVVASGNYTIEKSGDARKGRVGFDYKSYVQPMPLVGGSGTGAPQGKLSNIRGMTVRLYKSGGFRYGKTFDAATLDRKEVRKQDMPMDEAVPLFTGDMFVEMPSGWDDRATVYIEQDQPLPLTILAIYPRLTVEDSH